jgi:hypothetical protein
MRILSIIILLLSTTLIISCKKSVKNEVITQTQQLTVVEEATEIVVEETTQTTNIEVEETLSDKTPEAIKKEAKKVVNRKKAKMSFKEKEYNYGMIEQGDEVVHNFTFTNTGDADLVVKSADATCGCTTPEYPFVPIKPGKTGKIGVKFNSTGKLGPQKPMVTLVTNASPRVHRIYLNGFVNAGPKETPEVIEPTVIEQDLIEPDVEIESEGNVAKGEILEIEEEVIDNQ